MGFANVKTLTDNSVRNCVGDIRAFKPTIMTGQHKKNNTHSLSLFLLMTRGGIPITTMTTNLERRIVWWKKQVFLPCGS